MRALALGLSLALAVAAEARGQACYPCRPGVGTVAGAVAGGLVGRALAGRRDNTAAIVGGSVLGGVAGRALLDRRYRMRGAPGAEQAPAIVSDRERALGEVRRRQAAHAEALREHERITRDVAAASAAAAGSPVDVAAAQRLLVALGHYDGPVDGLPGPRTRSGVMRFEESQGLPRTGALTPATVARMRAAL